MAVTITHIIVTLLISCCKHIQLFYRDRFDLAKNFDKAAMRFNGMPYIFPIRDLDTLCESVVILFFDHILLVGCAVTDSNMEKGVVCSKLPL